MGDVSLTCACCGETFRRRDRQSNKRGSNLCPDCAKFHCDRRKLGSENTCRKDREVDQIALDDARYYMFIARGTCDYCHKRFCQKCHSCGCKCKCR